MALLTFNAVRPMSINGSIDISKPASAAGRFIAESVAADAKLTHVPECCCPSPRTVQSVATFGLRQFTGGQSKSAAWGCGQNLGLPGGRVCTHTKTAFAPSSFILNSENGWQPPFGNWGKVYLSPMIDCFEGMVVSGALSTRSDAELVNTMLDAAV